MMQELSYVDRSAQETRLGATQLIWSKTEMRLREASF